MTHKPQWEDIFFREYAEKFNDNQEWLYEEIKDFIRSQITSAYNQGVEDMRRKCVMNVGMLRQWLNEDRITDIKKLVTNEEIEHWLKSN